MPGLPRNARGKQRVANERRELESNLAHHASAPNPDILSPDTVAELVSVAGDPSLPAQERLNLAKVIERNFTRQQMGAQF